ncbi:MAG: MBL fold metallo-hydrolase [Candidatus Lokiarchaeota archaeon]
MKLDDELVFLGTGGGRHNVRTQHRATGGILFKFNNSQAHIDPGPGSIIRMNQFNEDPTKTELFFVTHFHIDHFNDISVIIESSRKSFYDKNHNLMKKGILFTTKDCLQFISEYHLGMLREVVDFKPGNSYKYNEIEILGTKVKHSDLEGFGIFFKISDYSIVFSSDTMVFEDFAEQFNGADIIVLNLLRPDSVYCKRHLCTDEVIPYLNRITPTPKSLIITHFGWYMDGYKNQNFVESQVNKLKQETHIKNVIAATDGLKVKILDLV